MRLVDKNVLLKELSIFKDTENGNESFLNGIETAKEIVENAHTVDAVPVVHGHWYLYSKFSEYDICSACGIECLKRIYGKDSVTELFYSFCPNCGAKMDGEVEE